MKDVDDIQSLNDFWQVFNNICTSLTERNCTSMVFKLRDAKSWVDDPSDDWFEFWYSLDYIIDNDAEVVNENEYKDLQKLSKYLEQYVPN